MFRPASCSLYLHCSQEMERKKKKLVPLFFLFTVQSSCSVGDLFSCGLWHLLLVPCSGIEPWLPALRTQSLSPWIIREVPMSFLNLFFFQVQFSAVAQSCLTLCDPMNHNAPGLPVHHQFPESTQTHVRLSFEKFTSLTDFHLLDNILQLGDFFFLKDIFIFLLERFLIL